MIAVKDYHDTKYDESLSSLKMIPTPSETQQLFLQTYSIEPYMMAYFNHDDPHRVYLNAYGQVHFIDSPSVNLTTNTMKQNLNLRACKLAPNDSNAQNDLENELNAVLQRVLAKLAKKRNKNNVTPVSESSKRTSPSAWQTLTDSEREELQRERRKRNAYKTSLCRSFRDSKTCPYGEECVFAHGEEELRLPPQAHPKYKTQLCNKFSVWNYCPYGARCQYIHQRVNEISKIDANTMKENSNENAKMNFSLSSLKKPSKHLRAMNKNVKSVNSLGNHSLFTEYDGFSSSLINTDLNSNGKQNELPKMANSLDSNHSGLTVSDLNCSNLSNSISSSYNNQKNSNAEVIMNNITINQLPEHFNNMQLDGNSNIFSQSCFSRIEAN